MPNIFLLQKRCGNGMRYIVSVSRSTEYKGLAFPASMVATSDNSSLSRKRRKLHSWSMKFETARNGQGRGDQDQTLARLLYCSFCAQCE